MTRARFAAITIVALARAAAADPPPAHVPTPCKAMFAQIFATGDRMVLACPEGAVLVDLPSGKPRAHWPAGPVTTGADSADGKLFALAERTRVRVYRTSDARQVGDVPLPGRYLTALAVAPDGSVIAASPVGSPPQVWSVAPTPRRVATLETAFGGAVTFAWSPDGSRLAMAADDTAVRIYDTKTWKLVATNTDARTPTLALAWSADGEHLAAAVAGGTIVLVDPRSGARVRAFPRKGDTVTGLSWTGDRVFARHHTQGSDRVETVLWSIAGVPTTVTDPRKVTGLGVVRGTVWLASPADDGLQLWTP